MRKREVWKEAVDINLQFEQALASQCAPALQGVKPSNLMVCFPKDYPDWSTLLQTYQRMLAPAGIILTTICRCERRWLLLVYRKACLEQQLKSPPVHALLKEEGYPVERGVDAVVNHLRTRMQDGFAHEIGLLLGYPMEDVVGFCRNHGRNYRYCGQWKVYSDVDRAKAMFSRFERCRDDLCSMIEHGVPLSFALGVA